MQTNKVLLEAQLHRDKILPHRNNDNNTNESWDGRMDTTKRSCSETRPQRKFWLAAGRDDEVHNKCFILGLMHTPLGYIVFSMSLCIQTPT
jgi:hypothetical protein